MRKIREVLRLCFDHQLGQREIARSAVVRQSTVHEYLARFAASGLTWPLPAEMSETSLEAKLYPKKLLLPRPPVATAAAAAAAEAGEPEPSVVGATEAQQPAARCPSPDWQQVEQEMQGHKYMTLQLAWEEYRQTHPDGYSYSCFCYHHQLRILRDSDHRSPAKAITQGRVKTISVLP